MTTLADRIEGLAGRHDLRCADCGKFIGHADLPESRHYFEPLNEYGAEVSEWTCPRCVTAIRARAGQDVK